MTNAVYENLIIRPSVANFVESIVELALDGNDEDMLVEMEDFCEFILRELTESRRIGRMSVVEESIN